MSDDERWIMQHKKYWKNFMDSGKVIVFGPVLDPNAVYGIGILSVNDEEAINEFIAGDPANKINSYNTIPSWQ